MKQRNTLPIWSIPFWIDLISVRIAFGLLSYCFAIEPTKKRSQVWDHFEMVLQMYFSTLIHTVTNNKPHTHLIFNLQVKCLLCSRHLAYNNNTSSMMRHYRAKHENEAGGAAVMTFPPGDRKQELDEALVVFIVKDSQPFTVVSDPGFCALVAKLDPTYILPSRQTVKAMVERRYVEEKEKAKAALQNVDSVSLTADMWTSINMDAYLAVTCHAIHAGELSTTLVGVRPFPISHTAENIAGTKVKCLVTDAAANMIAAANILRVRHAVCLAHALNLIVKKAMDATPGLDNIRSKTRWMITHFKSSTTAKEKLQQIQVQMGRPVTKLIIEVDTRWNSTYEMLQRFYEQRDAVAAALTTLPTDFDLLTANDFECASECMKILSPFHAATIELSHEKRVSGSKIIPLIKMLKHALSELMAQNSNKMAKDLGINLNRIMNDKLTVHRLKSECAALLPNAPTEEDPPSTSTVQPEPAASSQGTKIREFGSIDLFALIHVRSKLYDPLVYWTTNKARYPNLYHLANQYLATPASSLPCERVFSKAGEIVSKKRNRLKPSTVEKLLFLNKNWSRGRERRDLGEWGCDTRSRMGGRAFSYQAPLLWNQLPVQVREADSISTFKIRL
uniref:BED-type domain-containing protein n=1 Tax=Takifugu rubripes TaxID=31033 RepID=A0A674MKY1_TAKRU